MDATKHLHAVVMAGGSGTRFWPLSRAKRPKQLVALAGERSLLAATFERVRPLVGPERWWMVVGAPYADACRADVPNMPERNVLIEPQGKNTAPALALAALHLMRHDPSAIMLALPADHHVRDVAAFNEALELACRVAAEGAIVTLGIGPTHPATGYGYIERGEPLDIAGAYRVSRFCEKPQVEQAKAFLAKGGYDWNAGIFVMRPSVLWAEVERQLPKLARTLESAVASYDAQALARAYAELDGISIDYGVMEGAQRVAVVPVQCGWSDVGSWDALSAVVDPDARGNVLAGRVVAQDSERCVVHAGSGVVAILGLRDVVVAHTHDATLVLPVSRAQEVRGILEAIREQQWEDVL